MSVNGHLVTWFLPTRPVEGGTIYVRPDAGDWKRASSCSFGDCVEVDIDAYGVLVRDSKDPNGPELSFTREEWTEFVAAVKAGEFDPVEPGSGVS